ncbi:MAG TPA: TonB-dependent receptor, partial [Terriglobales bacterium]|nr:TonB-dependent receptor [Terriglobales bacterium]
AVVTGADLTLISPATSVERRTTSGSDGSYSFFNLLPGRYELIVQAPGFAKQDFKDVVLEVGRTSTINVPMKLAQVGETVTVTVDTTQVELAQSEVQGMIPSQTITSIPLNGRNFLELAFLLPGNRPATNFDPTKTNTLEVSSAGQFGRGGNITVDGGDNNDEVVGGTLMNFPQDSIGEFQIATNRYTAEVGRSGSSIINIVTKQGGNDFHGDLFGFLRNRHLQARPATLAASQDKPRFDRQQFGGSMGGALARDKAWWFISGEDRNQHAAIPTAFRNFAARTIVPSSAGTPLDDVLLLARQDVRLNDRDSLFIRYGFNRSLETAQGSLRKPIGTAAQRQSSLNRFNSILGNWTRVFAPNKSNNLVFHVNTFLNEIPSFANSHPTFNTPALTLTNEIRFPSLQDGANFRIPQRTRLQRYQAGDTFTLVSGSHTLNFGMQWQKMYSDAVFDLFGSGTIFTTEDFATQDRNGDGVVNDLDIPVAVAIRSVGPVHPPFVPDIDNTYLGWFAQDDWKVRPNLTFNLGLRYELDTDLFGVGPNHDPCPLPLTTMPTKPCVWVRNVVPENRSRDPKDLSPRIGFAWDPFKKGTTVVRGGYGMYFDRVVLEVRLLELLLDGRAISLSALGGSTLDANGRFIPDPTTKQT